VVTQATLRDVAERAQVHPSTASRALNTQTRRMVNADTVTRVLEAAAELGYRPNSLARGLKLNRTFTIGVVVPDLTNPLFPPIVRGLDDGLAAAGYTVVIGNTDNDADKEASVLEAMGARRVDGLVLATARREYPVLEQLREARLPVVLVNRGADDPGTSSVTGDDHAGIGLAVKHLAKLGHRRIAHIGGVREVSTGLARYQAFMSWMQSEGLDFDPDLIVFSDWFQEEPGAAAFRELIDRGLGFTAVVAANDLIALGCYDVADELGMAIPGDVSVVGYNDTPFSDKFRPPLTTVHIPLYDMGKRAASLLLSQLEEPDGDPVTMKLPATLAVRDSTASIEGPGGG
jgi:LacI family transcriptional regulator